MIRTCHRPAVKCNARTAARRRLGAAMVEFAVVAPVFFLVIIAMVEFGRMIMVQQVMTNATREGARRAVIEGATEQEVRTLVENYLTNTGVNGATVDVTPSDLLTLGFGDDVRVEVAIPFNSVSWAGSPRFLDGATLRASTIMHAERLQ